MKSITANRLTDGKVVYLGDDDQWTTFACAAAIFDDHDARDVLKAAQSRCDEITEAYLIDVSGAGALEGRKAFRESIRRNGPTIDFDASA